MKNILDELNSKSNLSIQFKRYEDWFEIILEIKNLPKRTISVDVFGYGYIRSLKWFIEENELDKNMETDILWQARQYRKERKNSYNKNFSTQ